MLLFRGIESAVILVSLFGVSIPYSRKILMGKSYFPARKLLMSYKTADNCFSPVKVNIERKPHRTTIRVRTIDGIGICKMKVKSKTKN